MNNPLAIVTLGFLSGARTYLAGGATIDVLADGGGIDLIRSDTIDVTEPGVSIDLPAQDKVLDIAHDRNTLDL